MESGGKANMIHISASTNHLLTRVIRGYATMPRGEIIVKGKGVMETFWLLGMEGDPAVESMLHDEQLTREHLG
ncbi:guanylyl cyclase [Aphelenchoides avenae]|nr:guanylyl cyclase [Aphelenchus avenae]